MIPPCPLCIMLPVYTPQCPPSLLMFYVPDAILTLVPSPSVMISPVVVYLDPFAFEKNEFGKKSKF